MTDQDEQAAGAREPIALILAAGAGRRLGRGPKALVELGGRTLAERAVRTANQAGLSALVTTMPQLVAQVGNVLPARAEVLGVPEHASGIAASLKRAAEWLAAAQPGAPVMLWLVDQPGVTVEVLRRLASAHRAGTITRAGYDGQPAHPVLFDAEDFQLAAASAAGDVGAKDFLRAHRNRATVLECADVGTAADLDTEADYRGWVEEFEA